MDSTLERSVSALLHWGSELRDRSQWEEPMLSSRGRRSLGIFAVGRYSIVDLMFLPDSEKPLEYGFVNVAHMKGGWC